MLPATKHKLNGPTDSVCHSQGITISIQQKLSGVVISVNNIIELKMEMKWMDEMVYLLLHVHLNEKCKGLLRFWLRVLKIISLKDLFNSQTISFVDSFF